MDFGRAYYKVFWVFSVLLVTMGTTCEKRRIARFSSEVKQCSDLKTTDAIPKFVKEGVEFSQFPLDGCERSFGFMATSKKSLLDSYRLLLVVGKQDVESCKVDLYVEYPFRTEKEKALSLIRERVNKYFPLLIEPTGLKGLGEIKEEEQLIEGWSKVEDGKCLNPKEYNAK